MPLDRQPERQILPTVTLRNWERADLAGLVVPLDGRRAILVNADGSHHDYRVVGDLRQSALEQVVDVTSEVEWMRHQMLAMTVRLTRWPAAACWVEV